MIKQAIALFVIGSLVGLVFWFVLSSISTGKGHGEVAFLGVTAQIRTWFVVTFGLGAATLPWIDAYATRSERPR